MKSGSTTGWVDSTRLKLAAVKAPVAAAPATKRVAWLQNRAYTTTTALVLRQWSATTSPVIGRAGANVAVTTTGLVTTDGARTQVKYGTRTGWVDSTRLKVVPVKAPVAATPATKIVASLKGQSFTSTVNLHLRQAPVDGDVETTMAKGSVVKATGVVTADSTWYQVISGSETGWAMASYLKTGSAEATPASAVTKQTTAKVNLRLAASTAHEVVMLIQKDQTVTLTGKTFGDWAKVTVGAETGWVHTDYLR